MEEKGLRNNYIFTLVKLILFLIIFCFLVEFTREFWRQIRSQEGFDSNLLIVSILSAFAFNVFLVDINNFYKQIQKFFFHSTFFSYLVPSLLIVLGIAYFFLPKVFNKAFDQNLFIFLGGFVSTNHLIFVARENKGYTFTAFINYLFLFSIFFILILILFTLYLKNGFNISLGEIVFNAFRKGAILIQKISIQTFR
jgi:hypothetical protein